MWRTPLYSTNWYWNFLHVPPSYKSNCSVSVVFPTTTHECVSVVIVFRDRMHCFDLEKTKSKMKNVLMLLKNAEKDDFLNSKSNWMY